MPPPSPPSASVGDAAPIASAVNRTAMPAAFAPAGKGLPMHSMIASAKAVLANSARRKSAGDAYLDRRDPATSRSLLIAAAMPRAALSPAAAPRPTPIDSQLGLSPRPTISGGIVMINQADSLRARFAFAVTRMSLPAIFHATSAAFCQAM
jgi:hypothetical protein